MATDIIPQKLFSLEFHTRFFPRLLRDRLRRKKKDEQGTSFTSTMELMVTLAVCLILAIIGIPMKMPRETKKKNIPERN